MNKILNNIKINNLFIDEERECNYHSGLDFFSGAFNFGINIFVLPLFHYILFDLLYKIF